MMSAATNAARANHEMAHCPKGRMLSAASNGPTAEPPLPPTWKMDCAKLFLPPEAICATRDAVGWNIEEPSPTTPTAKRISGKFPAKANNSSPARVKHMPTDKA